MHDRDQTAALHLVGPVDKVQRLARVCCEVTHLRINSISIRMTACRAHRATPFGRYTKEEIACCQCPFTDSHEPAGHQQQLWTPGSSDADASHELGQGRTASQR